MLIFNSISEALSLHKICPICSHQLKIFDDKQKLLAHNVLDDYNLCYELINEDLVLINKSNDSIKFIINNNYNIYYNNYFCPIKIECVNCMFCYTIIGNFDLSVNKIKNIYLSAEQFSIENSHNKLCVINNLYEAHMTEYTIDIFSKNMNVERIPLIPLNFKNPKETLHKIEKLLLFM